MTQREYDVESAKATIRKREIELREAKNKCETGTRKAKAEYEEILCKLNSEIQKISSDLERDKAWLAACETKIKEPYKGNED